MRKEYFQIGLGVTAILGLLAVLSSVALRARDENTDDNFCSVARPPKTHVIVVIDATDPRTPVQIEALRNRVEAARKKASRGDRLTLVEQTEDPSPSVAFSKCSPGRPEECGIAEPCQRIEAKYRIAYQREMNRIMFSLAEQTTRPESPLLEVLHQLFEGDLMVNDQLISGGLDGDAPNVRLILFTDAVQYRREPDMRTINFIGNQPDIEAVEAAHPDLLDVDLSRVHVEMMTIPRSYGGRPVQSEALWEFWEAYFAVTGARSYQRIMLPRS